MTPLRLATLSLVRRKVSTLITVASIALSVGCSGTLLRLYHLSAARFDSLGRGWEAVVGAKAGGIEILLNSLNGEGPYPGYLPYALFESLHASQTVQFEDGRTSEPSFIKAVSPFLYFAKFKSYRVAGVDENFVKAIGESSNPFVEGGRWVQGDDELVVGNAVRAPEYIALRPWVGGAEDDRETPARVVGRLRATNSVWDRMIFATIGAAQKMLSGRDLSDRSIWGIKVLNYFFINLNPGGYSPLQALINKRTVGQVVRVTDEIQKLQNLGGIGKSMGLYISTFILLLSCLSVSSMLVTRFEAMSVQLAVLRAIGYGRSEVGGWLVWEGILLGLSGCVLGIVIDGCGFPIVRGLLGAALPPPDVATVSLLESWRVWILTIAATVAAVFIPLIRLYRQDVHSSLKT